MTADTIHNYIRQLEADLATRNQAIAEQNRLIDLMAQRLNLGAYTGNNYDLAPDAVQEIVRAWRRVRPEKRAP